MRIATRQFPSFTLAALLGAVTGCTTVTERLTPAAEDGAPTGAGRYLHETPAGLVRPPSQSRDDWWRVFQDPTLDRLMTRLNEANPTVAAALARVDQSFAVLGITRSAERPTIRGDASAGRRRDSVNNLLFPIATPEYSRYRVGLSASWELDLWGRVRAAGKRDAFRAEAGSATYAGALLSLQATLAQQYFAQRSAESALRLAEEFVRLEEARLQLEQARLEFGQGVAAEVARATVLVQTARAGLEVARRNDGKLRHAIATLTGVLPSGLGSLDPAEAGAATVPSVPAGLPAELLTRRPDLLAADRQLRAAATQVGIRKADFLPRITLVGNGGFASLNAENLFEANGGFFDLGPQVDIPIFGGGVRKAAVAQARAQFQEAAANYRAAFLTAAREVDDALLDVRSYGQELALQSTALHAAATTADDAKARQEAGLAGHAEWIAAEQARLQVRMQENLIAGEHRLASVRLIQALGGSW